MSPLVPSCPTIRHLTTMYEVFKTICVCTLIIMSVTYSYNSTVEVICQEDKDDAYQYIWPATKGGESQFIYEPCFKGV